MAEVIAEFKLSTESKIIILTAVLASLLEIIDTTIVNVAVPSMMGNLGATLEDISWVVTGYIIANAIVLPIAGWLGMQIGRKKYYTGAILLFTLASFACGLAPNLPVLIAFRIIQGFMGGALLPTSQALLQEQFPREKAAMASAIYGMSVMIGPTLGPTLGGYLTDHFGWRSIFNINVPLGLIAATMAYLFVNDVGVKASDKAASVAAEKAAKASGAAAQPARVRTPIDYIGLGLLAAAIGSLQFVLERGQADDWFSSVPICICATIAVLGLPTFIWWELKTEHPILDLKLYKHVVLRSGTMLMACLGMGLYSLTFIIPIFVSSILGYTATQTGMLFIPGALSTAMLMPVVGGQLRKRDPRVLVFIGIVVFEAALVLLTHITSQSGERDLFWPLLVRGLAMAFLFVPINAVVLGQFSGPALGQVAGLMNLSRQIGGSIGIAALSTLLQRRTAQNTADLASNLSGLSGPAVQSLGGSNAAFHFKMPMAVGFAPNAAASVQSLIFRLQRQVFMLSFNQLTWSLFFAFGIALLPLWGLKGAKKVTGPVDAH